MRMSKFQTLGVAAAAMMLGAGMGANVGAGFEVREPPPVKLRYENTPTTRRGAGPSRHAKTIANRAKRARARLSRKKG